MPQKAKYLNGKNLKLFEVRRFEEADLLVFEHPADSAGKPPIRFLMRASAASPSDTRKINWQELRKRVLSRIRTEYPITTFFDMHRGLVTINDKVAMDMCFIDGYANSSNWSPPSQPPKFAAQSIPLCGVPPTLHEILCHVQDTNSTERQGFSVHKFDSEFKICIPEKIHRLKGMTVQDLLHEWRYPNESHCDSKQKQIIQQVRESLKQKKCREAVKQQRALRRPSPKTHIPTNMENAVPRHSSHSEIVSQGHKAIDSSSQKAQESSIFKPTILIPVVLTTAASAFGMVCVAAHVLKKRNSFKKTSLRKAEERKSGATVPVRFATNNKFKVIPATAPSLQIQHWPTQCSSLAAQSSYQSTFAASNFDSTTGLTESSPDFITVDPSAQGTTTDSREAPASVNTVKSSANQNID
eukprot:GHVT01013052.1.p1 GENE.GHVT01013052.1~~GHVT01013052.1.p1  ORF type:complete len:412 (-),score=39.56 GHVT01013052.1:565-1800(-)